MIFVGCRTRLGPPGFTLLEIMVALAISGIVFTCLFAVFSRVTDTAEQVERRLALSQDKRVILLQLIRDLDSLCIQKDGEQNGSTEIPFKGQDPAEALMPENATVLELCTAADLSFNSTRIGRGRNLVSYVLHRPDEDVFMGQPEQPAELVRVQTPFPGINGTVANPGIPLSSLVESFQVRFLNRQGLKAPSWNMGPAEPESPLPEALEIEAVLGDGQGETERFQLFYPLNPEEEQE